MKVINIGKHFISNSNIYSYKLHISSSMFRTQSFEINSLWMKHYHGERLALALVASRRRSSVLQCPNQYGVVLCCPGSLLCTDCTDFSLNSRLYSELTLLYKSEYLYVLLILMQYTNIQNIPSIVTLRAIWRWFAHFLA